ncbi:MAG: FeoA family protein [Terrimicrobiaceae bacterium]
MKLSEARPGITYEVMGIESGCLRAGRLSSLGFLPGCEVRIVHVAPLGDPVAVEMAGQEISVRLTEAKLVEVREVG